MNSKRLLSLALALCLALSLCACSSKPAAKTPEELNAAYTEAITAARTAEENEAFPFIASDDDFYAPMLESMGLNADDMTACALAVSMRGIQAYSVIAAMPAEGKADAVKSALEGYVEMQKQNFEFYLEDQFEIAKAAKLDTLKDGTLLLVMCENQDSVFESIKTALEK